MATPRPVQKIGLWKTPASRQAAAARSYAAPTIATDGRGSDKAGVDSLSARLLPEHFDDPALSDFFAAARGRVLVAEGDSWFDYPVPLRIDLLDQLQRLGRRVVSLAYRGDTLENMVYGTEGTDGDLVPPDLVRLGRMVAEMNPKAVLFSSGGNDVAGNEFAGFLNHRSTGRTPLREDYVDFVVNTYAKDAYVTAANVVWAANPTTKFITHGYANALPSGEGVGNVFGRWNLVGPWLKPALDSKGYGFEPGAEIVRVVLDKFNKMLKGLADSDPRFVYVDFRPHVGNDAEDWSNELHLTNDGIRRAANVLNEAIAVAIGE